MAPSVCAGSWACRFRGSTTQRNPPVSPRAIRRAWLTDVILSIHADSRQTYGMRRISAELADLYGHIANKKLIASIMRQEGIAGLPARRRRKPGPTHRRTNEDLVNRDFRREGPNQP
jgi:putative transposase